ncbi:hypothetical protein ACJ73_05537 [Blastomyces percursus]|uniref:Uncharacterized protein n=1 Tax=Blastomyces percursus TaxID=1658174 RepID=A0A1J9Q3H7_9EURO|nr:hypothetical protein ACJ73_05537 [Blastomyces percursus]
MDSRVQQLLAELAEERALREEERALRKLRKHRRKRKEDYDKRNSDDAKKQRALLQIPSLPHFHPTSAAATSSYSPSASVPSRIIIWDNFFAKQEAFWRILNDHPLFLTKMQFPSKHQLEYVLQFITPITSESDLRYYEREAVENQVRKIVDRITEDETPREAFGLRGSITFESHTNLGRVEKLSINPETAPSAKGKGRGRKKKEESTAVTGGQADRFCVYRQDGDEHIPAIAIEYKAPHKLTQAEMTTGLSEEIRPARDVIGQESEDVTFYCRRLVAAVITQLFSYMVRKRVRYGYVCTGEAFIFVYIPDDPSSVQCALCIPDRDVKGTDDDDLQWTAVAQVLAFTIRALTSPPVPQQWSDAADGLDVWPVEYSDILDQTPPAARLKHASHYCTAADALATFLPSG